MPFIGTQPDVGGYSVLDALTASATASYTLQKDSTNFSPSSANQLLVSLNGVIQKPGSSFTVSGSTLTFSSALDSSDSIDFILAMGEPLLVGTPSDGTVNADKLATNAVSSAKIASNAVTTAKIANSSITDAKISGVSTSKFSYNAGDVVQRVSTSVQDHPHPTNPNNHIASDGNGAITETTAYSSASLTPLLQLAITKKITASKLIVGLTGRFSITTGYRSQIALHDAYTAGQVTTAGGASNIGYYHYGIYNATGGDLWTPGSYEYTITGISAGTSKTYYWFGGSIGAGTQKYAGLCMTITEIAT